MRNHLNLAVVKLAVGLLLIAVLVNSIHWETLLLNIENLNGLYITTAFSVLLVQFAISAYKWQMSLRLHGVEYSLSFLQKVRCIGFFFNNFLPTSIGGDAYRAIRTMPKEGFKSRAVSAILVERIIGLSALLFLGCIAGILILINEPIPIVLYFVLACLAAGIVFIAAVASLRTGFLSGLLRRFQGIEKLEALTHNLNLIYRDPRALVDIFGISLIYQFLAIVAIAALFVALDSDGNYAKCAVIAAVVGLVSMIPISINGIGVIEGAFAVTAAQLGFDFQEAVIVAFLLRMLVVPLSLACGLIYLIDSRGPRAGLQNSD